MHRIKSTERIQPNILITTRTTQTTATTLDIGLHKLTNRIPHTYTHNFVSNSNITKMGNCLKRSTTDDISLLRGSNEPDRESSDQLGPPPLYSVSVSQFSDPRIWDCPIIRGGFSPAFGDFFYICSFCVGKKSKFPHEFRQTFRHFPLNR